MKKEVLFLKKWAITIRNVGTIVQSGEAIQVYFVLVMVVHS